MGESTSGAFLRAIACRVENLIADPEMLDYDEEREPADRMGDIPREQAAPSARVPTAGDGGAADDGAGSDGDGVAAEAGATYHDAINPGERLRRRQQQTPGEEEESSLTLFLRVRKMDHYSTALSQIGAKTISDLAFLTPQDLETVGIRPDDINNLTVNVVQ